jgi:uncharacterized protein YdaU (DUF1376 family)
MSEVAKPDTWMPLVIGDYHKDTNRLTTEQHGAYLLLIMNYWVEGPPPDDDDDLAAITKLDPKAWKKHRPKIARFFRIVDGVWRHKRVDQELAEWTERKRKNIARAQAGGRGKAAKSSASGSASSTAQAPKSGAKNLLEGCSASASREVDGPTGQSTLSDERSIFDLEERIADAALRPCDDERSWAMDVKQAEDEELLCRRSDPDRASELCEFIGIAQERITALRRARLSVVAA